MNVVTVKTGKPGRPAFRCIPGKISASGSHWSFSPAYSDLFGRDSIFLSVPRNFPIRAKNCISRALRDGRDIDVILSFSGVSHVLHGDTFYDCRFVGFPSWVNNPE